MAINYPAETKNQAKELFLKGMTLREIANKLKIKHHLTVYRWSVSEKWKTGRVSLLDESLRNQLEVCTKMVNVLNAAVRKIDIKRPNPKQREILSNFNRYSNLQLKLIKQLDISNPQVAPLRTKSIFS